MTPTPSRLEELRAIAEKACSEDRTDASEGYFAFRSQVTPRDLLSLLDLLQRRGEAIGFLEFAKAELKDGVTALAKAGLEEIPTAFHSLGHALLNLELSLKSRPNSPAIESEVVPTHRHKKRGSEYQLIGVGKMQSEFWRDPNVDGEYDSQAVDMREVAIYRAVDGGSLWVRPREEFEDGRFESLSKETA